LLRSGRHPALRALAIAPLWRCGARLVWQPLRKQRGSRGTASTGPEMWHLPKQLAWFGVGGFIGFLVDAGIVQLLVSKFNVDPYVGRLF
jgi:hypothetical protein